MLCGGSGDCPLRALSLSLRRQAFHGGRVLHRFLSAGLWGPDRKPGLLGVPVGLGLGGMADAGPGLFSTWSRFYQTSLAFTVQPMETLLSSHLHCKTSCSVNKFSLGVEIVCGGVVTEGL